jgi:DNA anti-recombination protein RmuC
LNLIQKHQIALILIVGLVLLSWYFIQSAKKGQAKPKAEETIFVTGIIASGISMIAGLWDLDTANLQESTSIVLDHLQGAIAVNASAMACKIWYTQATHTMPVDTKGNSEINYLITELSTVLRENQAKADANTNLLTATLKSNQEQNNHQLEKLDRTLNNLAHDLSEQVLKSVQNLTKVMEEQIIAHLGKSFKELTGAVEQLINWQNNYKTTLDELQAIHHKSAQALEIASENIAFVAREADNFATTAEKLKEITSQAQAHHDQMVQALLQVQQAITALKQVAPEVSKNLEALVEDIREASTQTNQALRDATDQLTQNTQEVSDQFKETIFTLKTDTEEALDATMRSFAEKTATILTHTINQSAEAHGLASKVAKDVERARANGSYQ